MEFLLDPNIVFLNHGSFGACPREVHAEYQQIQQLLERQPVRFMQVDLPTRLAKSRAALGQFIGAQPDDVVFVTNPTFAVNEIARSIRLQPSDQVLVSDQEYGSCHNAWRFMAQRSGFSIVEQPIVLPVRSNEEIVEQFWSGVTGQTKVILLSQITSPTALTIPVAEICRRAREREIITVIDGAHAPGQIDVDVQAIGADFYTGTCHKWMCAPKGAAFLYARADVQSLLDPLVVGWGWGTEQKTIDLGSDFLDHHEWLGTHDPSAYLTVPTAIEYQRRHDWKSVRARCHQLAVDLVDEASTIPGVARVHANEFFQQMAILELTSGGVAAEIKTQFYEQQIEVPVIAWNDRLFVRVSIQAYNTPDDISKFIAALTQILAS